MKFIIKKAASLLITLVFVSLLVFLSFEFIPGDPASSLLGTQATPEKVEALREEMGLNRPTLVRYLDWSSGFIRGDMGTSYSYHIPVKEMVGGKVPITLALTLLSFCFTVMIAIPLGIYMAKHAGGMLDSFFGGPESDHDGCAGFLCRDSINLFLWAGFTLVHSWWFCIL